MDDQETQEFRRQTIEHLNDLLAEVVRRDEWLINSIWNVARGLSYVVISAIAYASVAFKDDASWYDWGLVGAGWAAWMYFQRKQMLRLEADDKQKIGRDSRLSHFASWWR